LASEKTQIDKVFGSCTKPCEESRARFEYRIAAPQSDTGSRYFVACFPQLGYTQDLLLSSVFALREVFDSAPARSLVAFGGNTFPFDFRSF
jgi:hypothetical protein